MDKVSDSLIRKDHRELHAHRTCNQVIHMLDRFIPDACRREAYEEVYKAVFEGNWRFIPIPPELDTTEYLTREMEALMKRMEIVTNGQ